jgi:hypothetical protein
MTLDEVINVVESQGYQLDKQPYKLNVVGIRNPATTVPEKFQDEIAYFYFDDNENPIGKVAVGTTSPSVYFLNNPMADAGTAILKQGQYKDTYKIGLHKGKYEALVQSKPVTVIRDNDRNSYLNFFAKTETGLYGINIHRATIGKEDATVISQDSAGCQVFQNESDFQAMMNMARQSKNKYGNNFTYTIIDKKQIYKRRINYALVGGIIIALTGYVYYLKKKKIF